MTGRAPILLCVPMTPSAMGPWRAAPIGPCPPPMTRAPSHHAPIVLRLASPVWRRAGTWVWRRPALKCPGGRPMHDGRGLSGERHGAVVMGRCRTGTVGVRCGEPARMDLDEKTGAGGLGFSGLAVVRRWGRGIGWPVPRPVSSGMGGVARDRPTGGPCEGGSGAPPWGVSWHECARRITQSTRE